MMVKLNLRPKNLACTLELSLNFSINIALLPNTCIGFGIVIHPENP